jgi:hypothetical protein
VRGKSGTHRHSAGFLRGPWGWRFLFLLVPLRSDVERTGHDREGWRHTKSLCTFVMAALIVAGCASGPMPRPSAGAQEKHPAGSLKERIFVSADEALFYEGILQMDAAKQETDYATARMTFSTLLEKHPDSKWCNPARVCLRLLAERGELLARGRQAEQESAECRKKAAEAATETQDVRLANEKLRVELAKIQQENEQLKKDIQRLKDLEVELQNRDRLLR